MKEIKPDQSSSSSKKEQVEAMFDSIAPKYDFLNRFLSLGIDKGWRTKAMKALKPYQPKLILDVATGTGDLALEAVKVLNPDEIIGLDLSEQMLQVGRVKIKDAGLGSKISMVNLKMFWIFSSNTLTLTRTFPFGFLSSYIERW